MTRTCDCCNKTLLKAATARKVGLTEVTVNLRTTDRTILWSVCDSCFDSFEEAIQNVYWQNGQTRESNS